jgi:hypothetical protein
MTMRPQLRFATVAFAASAVTSLAWVWFSPLTGSSATTKPIAVVANAYTTTVDSSEQYQVAPGATVTGMATCPENNSNDGLLDLFYATGGGYVMGGIIGDSIASATASYEITGTTNKVPGTPDKWKVVVTNPKLADSTVAFRVRVDCLEVRLQNIPGS